MVKTLFVLDDGKELSTEETITHLLREISVLKSRCQGQDLSILSLTTQLNEIKNV